MEVTDYSNKGANVVTLNPGKKLHRAEKFADHMSIYDVIVSYIASLNFFFLQPVSISIKATQIKAGITLFILI